MGKLWGSLDDVDNYIYKEAEEQTDEKDFETLKNNFSELSDLNRLKTLLVMLEEKKGAEYSQKFRSRDSLEAWTDYLSRNGIHTWTGIGVVEDEYVYAEIFLSYRSRPNDFFDRYQNMRDSNPEKYHRRMGEFFGYPEESIQAFISKPSILQRLKNKLSYHTSGTPKRSGLLSVQELIEKYGTDLSDQEIKDIRTLIFYMPADSEEAFLQAEATAISRKEAIMSLAGEGPDFTYLQDRYIELQDDFGDE